MLIVAVLLMVMFTTLRLLRVASQRGLVEALWDGTRRLLRGAALVILLFLIGWGYNYRRQPLEASFPGGKAAAPTIEALQAAVLDANALGCEAAEGDRIGRRSDLRRGGGGARPADGGRPQAAATAAARGARAAEDIRFC